MASPKHQHFIPRSYLKFFAQKKGELYWVDTVMLKENEQIKTLPTTNVCVQKNLYTFPLNTPGDRYSLEKFYAVEVDAVYPEVYAMLVNSKITVISADDKRKILNTILSLFFRTPRFLNERIRKVETIFDEITSTISEPEQEVTIGLAKGTQIKFKIKDKEQVLEERRQKIKEEFLISHFADWEDFVGYKMDCEIEIISVTDELPIITSDNPVVIMNMDGQLNFENIFHHENIIEVPINRTTYLIIYPNSLAESARLRITRSRRDKYFSVGVNRSIEKNADGRIISYPGDLGIYFEKFRELDEFNRENIEAFEKLLYKTELATELRDAIKQNNTSKCQEVANVVKKIRKSKLMDEDEMFQKLITVLAMNGFLTA